VYISNLTEYNYSRNLFWKHWNTEVGGVCHYPFYKSNWVGVHKKDA